MIKKFYNFIEWLFKPTMIEATDEVLPQNIVSPSLSSEEDARKKESGLKKITASDLDYKSPYRILNHIGEIYEGGGVIPIKKLHEKYPLEECAAQELGFVRRVGENYVLSESARNLCEDRMKKRTS